MYLSISKFLKQAYINFCKTLILIMPFGPSLGINKHISNLDMKAQGWNIIRSQSSIIIFHK